MTRAARLVLAAQLCFWAAVAVCFVLDDGGLGGNHGFSVYGGSWHTVVPWAVGFCAAGALLLLAAAELDATDPQLALGLRLTTLFLLGDLFTPDTVDQAFYVLHIVASVLLFLFQAILGLWLVHRAPARGAIELYALQIAGGIVAGLSQAQWIGLLSPGILVFQVAFGALLVRFQLEPHGDLLRGEAPGTD